MVANSADAAYWNSAEGQAEADRMIAESLEGSGAPVSTGDSGVSTGGDTQAASYGAYDVLYDGNRHTGLRVIIRYGTLSFGYLHILRKHGMIYRAQKKSLLRGNFEHQATPTTIWFKAEAVRRVCEGWFPRKCTITDRIGIRTFHNSEPKGPSQLPFGLVTGWCKGYITCPTWVNRAL